MLASEIGSLIANVALYGAIAWAVAALVMLSGALRR